MFSFIYKKDNPLTKVKGLPTMNDGPKVAKFLSEGLIHPHLAWIA